MFSVVIPLYNKADYIENSIRSVLYQTFEDFELIIVNDGSTDGSVSKATRFKDHRVRIVNQSNAGVSAARNTGVTHANYDFIAFLDADDWWHKDFLHEIHILIADSPDAGLYGSGYYLVKNGIFTPARIGLPHGFEAGYIDYFEVYARTFWVPINCSFVVVRKSDFIAAGGFRVSLKFGEDFDLWVRMALKGKVAYLNKLLAYSNQDVAPMYRALGEKHWKKEEHYIFNIDYLEEEENRNSSLKVLLDGLRVRNLQNFYLKRQYIADVFALLGRVDFSQQPMYYRFFYHLPWWQVRIFMRFRQYGSKFKQALIRIFRT